MDGGEKMNRSRKKWKSTIDNGWMMEGISENYKVLPFVTV